MAAVTDMPFVATRVPNLTPDFSMLEQSRQSLARIESELCQKLKAITTISCPPGTDEVHWKSARVDMEAQAKKDAEKEKLPYKTILQLSEQCRIYESLLIDGKTLAANPKEITLMLSDERTTGFEEAEKNIAALVHQASHKNASLELNLRGLLLQRVPDEIEKLSSTLVKLDLSNNHLEILPESVTSLVNLIHLDIRSNQLTSLPDSIERLVKLKVFNVSGNSIATLTDRIENCRALEELMVNFNQLTWLPEGLGFELLNLRKLCVHSNKLTHLPYSTSHMMSLHFLDVHMNKLRGLPEDLENLTNLEYLDLSSNFNYLGALPESIGGLTSLIELNISYNQITALPDSIGRLEKLQHLKVEGNPLVVPPPKVVAHSVVAMKEYMAERLKGRRGDNKRGMKIRAPSWLRQIASGKWAKWGTPKQIVSGNWAKYGTPRSDVTRTLSWQELLPRNGQDDGPFFSLSTPPRRAFFSPLRLCAPRHSFLGTPRRTPHHI